MSLTDRDRKIVIALLPLLVLLGYYFLLLKPKREEAAKAGTSLAKQEKRRDKAVAKESRLGSARTNFAADYREVVRLGKAVPASVDLPSLIVQLDRAAGGTGIRFDKIATGARSDAPGGGGAAPGGGSGGAPAGGAEQKPADSGGEPAQSGAGQASEGAGGASDAANQDAQRAQSTGEGGGAQTSTATPATGGSGGVPVGGGSAGAAGGGTTSGVAGLDAVPLDFQFRGSFFDLADFFHRLKRFVRVVNDDVQVNGRLLTIEAVSFKNLEEGSTDLTADVKGTVYLAPRKQGSTAGATPKGPGSSVPAGQSGGNGTASPTTPTGTGAP